MTNTRTILQTKATESFSPKSVTLFTAGWSPTALVLTLVQVLVSHSINLNLNSSGPTLSVMLAEKGHRMEIYDAIYAPDESIWKKQFDFITCSEVVEHLINPHEEIVKLWSCLKPGGHLPKLSNLTLKRRYFGNHDAVVGGKAKIPSVALQGRPYAHLLFFVTCVSMAFKGNPWKIRIFATWCYHIT